MPRERTAGESPRDGAMEVAFEQWPEPQVFLHSKRQRRFHVTGKQYSWSVLSECRDFFSEIRW